jgi:trehalose 6-phosphate phosphatase
MIPLVERIPSLWIYDFDGTLSLLVKERSAATILPEAKGILIELSRLPGQEVAVLSSRTLDDLIPRVDIPELYLGAGSGTEWLLPDGRRIIAEGKTEPLLKARKEVLDDLRRIETIPGVDLEDKKWSVAVHVRGVSPGDRAFTFDSLTELARTKGVRILRGPEVFEVQILPEIDKLFGVKTLCRLTGFAPESGRMVYSGDDENDAVAMEWVIRQGGVAFSIGSQPLVQGAIPVAGPDALVREVSKLAGLNEDERRRKDEPL